MSKRFAEYKATHPNAKKETVLKNIAPVYERPGRTKQSFKDSTDINKILAKAEKGHAVSHLNRYQPEFGDFTDMPDLLTAQARLERGQEIFDALPGELRREFKQSPQEFFAFVNDPANSGRLGEIFPDLAKVGNQRPDVIRTAESVAAAEAASGTSGAEPSVSGSDPAEGDTGAVSA